MRGETLERPALAAPVQNFPADVAHENDAQTIEAPYWFFRTSSPSKREKTFNDLIAYVLRRY
jgi:hypothetical protein